MGARDAELDQDPGHHVRQARQRAVSHILVRLAVPRKVNGDDGRDHRQRGNVESPAVQVSGIAVDQHHRFALTRTGTADPDATALDYHGGSLQPLALGGGVLRCEAGLELHHEGLDIGLRRLGLRQHRDQPAHRHGLAGLGHDPAQHTARGRLERVVDLGRLNVDEVVALRHRRPLRLPPVDDRPLLHGEPPLGHTYGRNGRHRSVLVVAGSAARDRYLSSVRWKWRMRISW